jgi:hypothetical protein
MRTTACRHPTSGQPINRASCSAPQVSLISKKSKPSISIHHLRAKPQVGGLASRILFDDGKNNFKITWVRIKSAIKIYLLEDR